MAGARTRLDPGLTPPPGLLFHFQPVSVVLSPTKILCQHQGREETRQSVETPSDSTTESEEGCFKFANCCFLFSFFAFFSSVSKHQDGGMYKTPAYPGYPFLMLPDPYLPNGSVSPSVSTLIFWPRCRGVSAAVWLLAVAPVHWPRALLRSSISSKHGVSGAAHQNTGGGTTFCLVFCNSCLLFSSFCTLTSGGLN